jgi:hypothetical protein
MKRDHLDAFSLPRIDLLESPLSSPGQSLTGAIDDFTDSGYTSEPTNTPQFNGSVQSSYATMGGDASER